MQHETIAEDVTPPRDSHVGTGGIRIHASTRAWQRPRVRVHESVDATPVTSLRAVPFAPRIRPLPSAADVSSAVRRKLFSISSVPRPKRRRADHRPLAIKIDSQLERTQPADDGPERKPSYSRGGFLTTRLHRAAAEALADIRDFRLEIAARHARPCRLQAVLDRSLVFWISALRDGVLYASPWTATRGEGCDCIRFVLLVSSERVACELDLGAVERNVEEFAVFVPWPWYVTRLTDGEDCEQWVVTSSKIDLFKFQHTDADLLNKLSVNKLLHESDGLHQLQIHGSHSQECNKERLGNGHTSLSFSEISPHTMVVSVVASVFAVVADLKVAILRDVKGIHALLKYGDVDVEVSPEMRNLCTLHVCEQTISIDAVVELLCGYAVDDAVIREIRTIGRITGCMLVLSMSSVS